MQCPTSSPHCSVERCTLRSLPAREIRPLLRRQNAHRHAPTLLHPRCIPARAEVPPRLCRTAIAHAGATAGNIHNRTASRVLRALMTPPQASPDKPDPRQSRCRQLPYPLGALAAGPSWHQRGSSRYKRNVTSLFCWISNTTTSPPKEWTVPAFRNTASPGWGVNHASSSGTVPSERARRKLSGRSTLFQASVYAASCSSLQHYPRFGFWGLARWQQVRHSPWWDAPGPRAFHERRGTSATMEIGGNVRPAVPEFVPEIVQQLTEARPLSGPSATRLGWSSRSLSTHASPIGPSPGSGAVSRSAKRRPPQSRY